MTETKFERVIRLATERNPVKFSNGQYRTICPAHDDKRPSLDIKEGLFGKVIFCCRSNHCTASQIATAYGLTMADLFPDDVAKRSKEAQVEETYDYRDEQGNLLFQVVRLFPKAFFQRRPSGKPDGWIWGIGQTRRVLYCLKELIESDKSETVYIVEGERKVNYLRRMGFVATCNSGGAGNWRKEYNEFFKDRNVVILPDEGEAGAVHAEKVERALKGIASSIRVFLLPGLPEKGDVVDWIHAGGTKAKLLELLERKQQQEEDPWEVPVPLDEVDVDVIPFPLEVFPKDLANYCQSIADTIPTPVDYPACFALALSAGLIGSTYQIEIKEGYKEQTGIYLAVIAPPTAGKTPVLAALRRPIDHEQIKRKESGDDSQLYVSDATVEAIAQIMSTDSRGVLMIRDELAAWVSSMDQYKSGKGGSDRQFYLSGWSGEPVKVNRKDPTAKPIFIGHPTISVVGGIQPAILAKLRSQDDGLFDRMLFCFPIPFPPTEENWKSPDKALGKKWSYCVDGLLSLQQTETEKGKRPNVLSLSKPARESWSKWTKFITDQQKNPDFPDTLQNMSGKLKGYVARFALIIHLLRDCYGEEVSKDISADDIERAAKLGKYFLSHAIKANRVMRSDPRIEEARVVLRAIVNHGKEVISRRDIYRSCRRSFQKPEGLYQPLKLLQELNYIKELGVDSFLRGRKPTEKYQVNPILGCGDNGDNGDKKA